MGIRDGSFSHFSFYEKWEKEPSLIPIFPILCSQKWEKEPSLIPIFPPQATLHASIFGPALNSDGVRPVFSLNTRVK